MHIYLMVVGEHGKTSAAKILARAINCLNPKDGEPCNECEICKGAISGSITDIVEMDAASNNSVEDIRSIREEVNFLPTIAKYRVYIIDEVHMLSTGAFNALLKTLEEPPKHVKFILATTEPQKLPATILSRCQRFDFKKISDKNITKRLEIVCNESNIDATEEALNMISILSEGAMRDALSILERCIQDGDTKIDEDKVKDLVGIPKFTYISELVEAIFEYNATDALDTLERILDDGKDINNVIWEVIKYIKDILVYKTSGKIQLYNKEEIDKIKQLSEKCSKDRLLKLIYLLSEIETDIKNSTQRLIMAQAGIIKICRKEENLGIEELKEKVISLEKEIENIKVGSINSNMIENKERFVQTVSDIKVKEGENKAKVEKSKIKSEDYWTDILNELKRDGKIMLYTNLINTKAKKLNDMVIGIEFQNGITAFGKTVLEKPENKNELKRLVSMACGQNMEIKYMDSKSENNVEPQNNLGLEQLVKDLDVPINIIEE